MPEKALCVLKEYLQGRALEVRALEAEAERELHGGAGQKAYETIMRQKAELLRDLFQNALEQEGVNGNALPEPVLDRLKKFSASAAMSLQVGSVFFMSALLYPDDHVDGAPNDLETFVQSLDCVV